MLIHSIFEQDVLVILIRYLIMRTVNMISLEYLENVYAYLSNFSSNNTQITNIIFPLSFHNMMNYPRCAMASL